MRLIATAILALIRGISGLCAHRWPEGEPIVIGGRRIGTRLADGTLSGAPGLDLTPLGDCQFEQADQNERSAAELEQDARDAG